MKAIVMHGFGSVEKLRMEEREKPEPGKGQVRVRVKAAGFNPVDWKIREGWYKVYGEEGERILGCDYSGVVDGIGSGVKRFDMGDEVYGLSFLRSSNGSYAEYVCVPVELVGRKPKGLSFEEAAAVPLAGMTAYRAVKDFKKGDVIFGVGLGGGVGSFAVQMMKGMEIWSVARDEASREFLRGMGLENVLIYGGLGVEELRKGLGRLFDGTLDLVGGDMKKLCLEVTGYSGRFATIVPEKEFLMDFWKEDAIPRVRNLSVLQVALGAELVDENRKYWKIYGKHLEKLTKMIEEGELKVPAVKVVGELGVESVKEAHRLLESRRVKGKLVMRVD